MLYGIRFATNPALKELFLEVFIGMKERKVREYEQGLLTKKLRWAELLGADEEMLKEIRQGGSWRYPPRDYSEISNFMRQTDCQHYYITKPVLELCSKLRVKEPYDVEWLSPLPDGTRQLNFPGNFIRYSKTGNRIVALAAYSDTDKGMPTAFTAFNFDLEKKKLSSTEILDDYDEQNASLGGDYDAVAKKQFFQLITFMELAPIEEITIPVGTKHGTKKSPENLLNTQRFPITVVNSSWNKVIRRQGVIDVGGHFRKQAYGPQYSKRRLIYILPFSYESFPLEAQKTRITVSQGKKL